MGCYEEVGAGWTARIEHQPPDGAQWGSFRAHIRAMNEPLALATAQGYLDRYAKGKRALIRNLPEATTETDFATNERCHKGYVRFHYRDEPGEWEDHSAIDRTTEIRYLPLPPPNPPLTPLPCDMKGEEIVARNVADGTKPDRQGVVLTDDRGGVEEAFNQAVEEFKAAGCKHLRATLGERAAGPNPYARKVLLEGWYERPEVEAEPDWDGALQPKTLWFLKQVPLYETHNAGCACINCCSRRDICVLFQQATVTDMQPHQEISDIAVGEAAKIVGRDATLICAVEKAVFAVRGFYHLKIRLEPARALGSAGAWAMISKDGKRAVVGWRGE